MTDTQDSLFDRFLALLREKYGDRVNDFLFPPPVFLEMQGGMIAAAIDNTVGPLSAVIAPPNVTRTLEVKYSQPVTMQMEYILVGARLVERSDPKLVFEAKVTSPSGNKLATCKAVHWILEKSSKDANET